MCSLKDLKRLVLVCRTEEVEDNLNRVECLERNLYEEGVPVAHGSVPQAWKLKCLELAALIALRADEACILIDILEEVEALALVVVEAADDVDRVEVGCRSECLTCMVVRHVDLYALENLERCRSVLLGDDERTAARLTLILHHTCDAYRTVQLLAESINSCLRSVSLRHLHAENVSKELLDVVAERKRLRSCVYIIIKRIVTRNTCCGVS